MDTRVNACLNANTYTLNQVSDVFTMAQRLVVYPFWPLFDVGSTDLTPKARAAGLYMCTCTHQPPIPFKRTPHRSYALHNQRHPNNP